jgi:hypothetical protein
MRRRQRVAALHIADDGLAALMHHDTLDTDHLCTLAAPAIQRRYQLDEPARRVRRGVAEALCGLEWLIRKDGSPTSLHPCVVLGDDPGTRREAVAYGPLTGLCSGDYIWIRILTMTSCVINGRNYDAQCGINLLPVTNLQGYQTPVIWQPL